MSKMPTLPQDAVMETMKFTDRIAARFRSLAALDVLLVSFTATLFFFLVPSIHLLPLHDTMLNNADILFIEEVARDLNAGGNLFDWRLTQAPYLFPDIAVARVLALFSSQVGAIAVYYYALFGITLLLLIHWLCRLARVPAFIPLISAAVLYATAYAGSMTADELPVYFGLIGHHCGVAVPLVAALAAVVMIYEGLSSDAAALSLLYASAFIGVVSDSLFAIAFAPVVFIFTLLCVARKEIARSKARKVLGTTAVALLLGKAFGYTNPFPQDREFMQFTLAHFPSLTAASFKQFGMDFVHYFRAGHSSAFIAAAFILAWIVSLVHLTKGVRAGSPANSAITLLSLFTLIGPLLVILIQNILGIYQNIALSRQWAVLVYLAIVFGVIVAVHRFPQRAATLKIALAVIQVVFLFHLTKALAQNKGITKDGYMFPPFITCMRESGLPTGPLYVADYWLARPIRMFSHGDFGVSAVGDKLVPLLNGSNVAQARKAAPRFIITGMSVHYDEIINRFGPPRAEHCKMTVIGEALRVLDYSNSDKAKEMLRNNAIKSY